MAKTDAHHRDSDALLTPAEVAALFRVSPKTVTRWAESGKLPAMRTLGGHRRFRASHVEAVLAVAEPDPLSENGRVTGNGTNGTNGSNGNGNHAANGHSNGHANGNGAPPPT
jgi:excisionase family DNA binding protein